MMRIAAILALMASLATPATAHDPSVKELFEQFGLFGRWAAHCDEPARSDNPHVGITVSDAGAVREEQDLGSDFAANRYRILSAERKSPTRLSVEVMFHAGDQAEQKQVLEFQVGNGTRRTMYNRPEGGAVRVKDGIALAVGTKTLTLKKCE
ncbi:MAG TPA: hypothetical protein VHV58_01060 [Pseudolabrys sp.]|jgi:hypothetical protein|nr:hypothetical protein [Pseudolabrys sp.]